MSSFLYGSFAAACAVGCEVYYRANLNRSYVDLLFPVGLLLALGVNFGVWGLLQTQTVLGMAVLFSFFVAMLRIVWTVGNHDAVSLATWVAFALVCLASLVHALWR